MCVYILYIFVICKWCDSYWCWIFLHFSTPTELYIAFMKVWWRWNVLFLFENWRRNKTPFGNISSWYCKSILSSIRLKRSLIMTDTDKLFHTWMALFLDDFWPYRKQFNIHTKSLNLNFLQNFYMFYYH